MSKGFVYILSNEAMIGLLKIGYSTKIPEIRAKELSSTGVPDAFRVSYYCIVENANLIEQEVHKSLSYCRYSDNREFFKVSLSSAIQKIKSTCEPEYEWSDEVLLKSDDGVPLNLQNLNQIHGIKIVSRRQKADQIEEMVNFCHAAYNSGLASYIKSLVYCSNSDCCSFEFTSVINQFSDIAKEIRLIACETISQFDWFGCVDHGKPLYEREFANFIDENTL